MSLDYKLLIESLGLIGLFLILIFLLRYLKKNKKKSFNFRVLTALFIGLIFGAIVQFGFGASTTNTVYEDSSGKKYDQSELVTYDQVIEEQGISKEDFEANTGLSSSDVIPVTNEGEQLVETESETVTGHLVVFMSMFSTLYIKGLKLMVIPLIFISISTAIIDSRGRKNLGKKVTKIISLLMVTVAISAVIGLISMAIFKVDGAAIVESSQSSEVSEQQQAIDTQAEEIGSMNYAELLLAPVPEDFGFLVGQGSAVALSTVLFGMFLGYAVLQVDKRKPEKVKLFIDFLNSFKEVVLSMVKEVLKITPYAILALMASFAATSTVSALSQLFLFVVATYFAIIVMFLIHLLILTFMGLSPKKFVKKAWPILVFGFGSRSSIAAVSLNVQAQKEEMGVDDISANLSSSFGVTMGQNGCAGIYPAMVAVMAMQIVGDPITFTWILMLIAVIVVSSFGIAGVGGGATFAAIAVLSILGLPVEIAAILISVEPLLDMARTVLNISGAMMTGVVTSKADGELDMEVYKS